MKLCLSSLHSPTLSPDRRRNLSRTGAALLLVTGTVFQINQAVAAPNAKATPTPTPTVAPAPTPTPTATPAATAASPAPAANYSGTQQAQYIATARDAFVALRTEKFQPFLDAHKALDAAGGISAKGLKTKEDIIARRDLVAKTLAANDVYLAFVKTQVETFQAELAKTPLTPNDATAIANDYFKTDRMGTMVKLRETESEALKAGDDMLAGLESRFGSWTISDAGKISFKKKSDVSAMNALSAKFNAKVAELEPLREQLKAEAASASPTASPVASPVVVPSVTPVASAKP